MGPGESQWLPEDREAALAWQAEQAMICGGCGYFVDEVYDAAGADLEMEAIPHRCHACAERDHDAREFTKTKRGSAAGNTDGLKWGVERRG